MRHRLMCWVGVLVCAVPAGCSSPAPAASHSVRPLPPLDSRLLGQWHVVSARMPKGDTVRVDDYSDPVMLDFRQDGLLATNGSLCDAPHVGSTGGQLELRWRSGTGLCYDSLGGGRAAFRLADALDGIQDHGRIRYSTDGVRLRLAANGYRILLRKGVPTPPRQTLSPSASPCCR